MSHAGSTPCSVISPSKSTGQKQADRASSFGSSSTKTITGDEPDLAEPASDDKLRHTSMASGDDKDSNMMVSEAEASDADDAEEDEYLEEEETPYEPVPAPECFAGPYLVKDAHSGKPMARNHPERSLKDRVQDPKVKEMISDLLETIGTYYDSQAVDPDSQISWNPTEDELQKTAIAANICRQYSYVLAFCEYEGRASARMLNKFTQINGMTDQHLKDFRGYTEYCKKQYFGTVEFSGSDMDWEDHLTVTAFRAWPQMFDLIEQRNSEVCQLAETALTSDRQEAKYGADPLKVVENGLRAFLSPWLRKEYIEMSVEYVDKVFPGPTEDDVDHECDYDNSPHYFYRMKDRIAVAYYNQLKYTRLVAAMREKQRDTWLEVSRLGNELLGSALHPASVVDAVEDNAYLGTSMGAEESTLENLAKAQWQVQ